LELTALSSRIGRANALVNFYVSHSSATKFLRGGKKYYIFCRSFMNVSNSKEFSKSVSIW